MENCEIAGMFEEIADLLEIEEASPFRVRAYRTAAATLRGLGDEVEEMVARGEPLTDLPGIGKDLAGKIGEAIEKGSIAALDTLHQELPATLEDLLLIPNLGPKRVRALFKGLGVRNLDELQRAAEAGRVRQLRGFSVKSEQQILESLATRRRKARRTFRSEAASLADHLTAYLEATPGVERVVVAGSFRRGKETVGDLDLLVTARAGSQVMERFVAYPAVARVEAKGGTRSTVELQNGLEVDLRLVPPTSFGAALHYFTGSKAHNIRVRRMGQQRGLKINEYGVFEGAKRVAGESEESVFEAVGLPWIPPELREDRGEIEAAMAGRLPRLVTRADLRGDLHSHTVDSDGRDDLAAMAAAARSRGLAYLAITDHAYRIGADGLRRQGEAIDALNQTLDGVTLLKGCEVDVLEDGRLALPDDVLATLDLVVISVHSAYGLSRERQTDRILRALDHRYISILAHPTGRMMPDQGPFDVDLPRVLRHLHQRGCFVELNSQPKRLDLTDTFCMVAREEGVLVSIDSDGHRVGDLDNLRYGVDQARRGWLQPEEVLNSRPLDELKRLLKAARG